MTATITYLAEYLATKNKTGPPETLSTLTDAQITSRIQVMEKVEAGLIVIGEIPHFIANSVFPRGYDPDNHEEDNLASLVTEAKRRGVALS